LAAVFTPSIYQASSNINFCEKAICLHPIFIIRHNATQKMLYTGLTQKLLLCLICVTAPEPRTPSFRRACVSPTIKR